MLKVLELASAPAAALAPTDVAAMVAATGQPAVDVEGTLKLLERTGLLIGEQPNQGPPSIGRAGRQYLARRGAVPANTLHFLPAIVDDLYAREALIVAGTILIDEFRNELQHGNAIQHAAHLVPAAFAQAVDQRLALDLYAASIALMVRLSYGQPAGCIAEEIIAVTVLENARSHLDVGVEQHELTAADAELAQQETHSLFDLFGDADTLAMFEMREPSDAALARHDPISETLGIVDQRLESWFEPFEEAQRTGYLGD